MAQYKIYDPEEMIECPYDKVHMIAAKRMQYHMMKCRRNHPGADFAVCPYNARHEVRKPELRYHMVNCPDKARLEPSILHEQNKQNHDGQYFKGNTDLPCYADSSKFESVENWDEEIPSVARIGVDPNYFMRLNARNTAGMSTKEKKLYMSQVNMPADERVVPEPGEEEEEEEQKLRLPHAKPETYMSFQGSAATHVGQIPPSTSVLALSLSRSGVGRGSQIGGRGVAQVTPKGPMPVGRGQPGLGRAAGRGLMSMGPPGYTSINTNTNSIHSSAEQQSMITQSAVTQPGQQFVVKQPAGQQLAVGMIGQAALRLPSSMMPNVFSMGLGRGSERGSILKQNGASPSFVIPNVKGISGDIPVVNSSGSEADDGNISSSSTSSNADNKKEKRRLVKKIRQIELLDQKVAEGYKLTSEEEIKCEKKDEILEALQNFKM
ncbi:uncharacterized protein LOC110462051 [Mizuhopecten yessoensis]|nr:uncharacterized protein LOC110462051 [Mizuhopecten yessoensis]